MGEISAAQKYFLSRKLASLSGTQQLAMLQELLPMFRDDEVLRQAADAIQVELRGRAAIRLAGRR